MGEPKLGARVRRGERLGVVTYVSSRHTVDVLWDGTAGPRAEVAERLEADRA